LTTYTDIICRYGGDEFVALLPQLPSGRAMETGERLRSAVENTSFDVDGQQISSTVSIGIASFPDEVGNVFDLLDKADQALYECKRTGRNKVTSFSSVQPTSEVEHVPVKRQYDPEQGGSRETEKI
jgi:diguanylate cyclase (GGDEF)-like protein